MHHPHHHQDTRLSPALPPARKQNHQQQQDRKKQPLSSINLNATNRNAGVRIALFVNRRPSLTHHRKLTLKKNKQKPSSISLLQPLYKNQNYMIPQKALDVSRSSVSSVETTKLSNALAELTKLAIPARKEERVAIRGDLLKIIEVCRKKLAACEMDR